MYFIRVSTTYQKWHNNFRKRLSHLYPQEGWENWSRIVRLGPRGALLQKEPGVAGTPLGREWSLLDAAPHLTTVERVIVVPPSLPSLVSLYLGSVARELVQGTPYQHSPRLLYPGDVASRVPWLARQTPGAVEVRARESLPH